MFTPVQSEAEKTVLAQQELLLAEADAERIRLMNEELKLNRERHKVGADQERLKIIASKVQKQSEVDALHIAMAEQRAQDEEFKADTEYRAAENRARSTEVNLQEEAENARNIVRAEEATQRFRALEIERQHEYNINEQRIRDESVARNMQQRLIELEHQSRATAEDLVNLSELKQREKPPKRNMLTRSAFEHSLKRKKGVSVHLPNLQL